MSRRVVAEALVAATLAASVATIILDTVLGAAARPGFGFPGATLVYGISCSLIGRAIATRRPRNSVAWVLLASGAFATSYDLTLTYGYYGGVVRGDAAPVVTWAVWLGSWLWIPAATSPVFLALLFPDGRLPSPRWRPVAWYAAFAIALFTIATALVPGGGPFGTEWSEIRPNPISPFPPGAFSFREIQVPTLILLLIAFAGTITALIRRSRASSGVQRQQLKWFVYTCTITGAVNVLVPFFRDAKPYQVISVLVLTAIPISTGIAILRYHLYDIDLLIKRTLVYGSLSAILGAMYVALALLTQALLRPVTAGSDIAVAISTLTTLALLQPVRHRIQEVVDHRFYRSHYDARRTIDAFTAHLRNDVDLDGLRVDLLDAVNTTIKPAHAGLWLRRQ